MCKLHTMICANNRLENLECLVTFPFPNTGLVLSLIVVLHHSSNTPQKAFLLSVFNFLPNSDASINYIVMYYNL